MVTCPSCGNDSPANSLHCVHCGAKFPSAAQRTQFGMPVLRPAGAEPAKGDADDKSTAEYAAQDLARLAMATRKTPGSALAGLGGLKTGRRPGSLLKGLPQFRGANPSPLTSGEFRLGGKRGDAESTPELGLYAGAKRSSMPPEIAPTASNPPEPGASTPEPASAEEPPPTVAMQGVTDSDLSSATPAGSTAEPEPTVAMQGVADSQLAQPTPVASLGDMEPVSDRTVEERRVEPAQIPKTSESVGAIAPSATPDAAPVKEEPTSEAPLPKAMRGSERAHHPGGHQGVQHARIDQSSGSSKWLIIGLIIATGIGVGVWLAFR